MPDTIAAISTSPAKSAIGIVRLSGDDAIDIVSKVFFPASGNSMQTAPDRKLIYGSLKNSNGDIIDICLCTVSRAPHSYTGENTAEIQCHGSLAILNECLKLLFDSGARQALPGEFTKRAFLNGRMDLIQAEAVIDLIDAETAAAARNAAGQLDGVVSSKIDGIYDSLLDVMSHFHAVVDYPDEDIDPFEEEAVLAALKSAEKQLKSLAATFDRGQYMNSGIPTAIIGKPNAGKSSLLNTFLGYERAIVTPIEGTTRDTISERVSIGGVLLNLTDTAGLHSTDDPVERIGIDRTISAADNAVLVIAIFDGAQPFTDDDREIIKRATAAPNSIAVINKSDLEQYIDSGEIEAGFKYTCEISAKSGEGLKNLEKIISNIFAGDLSETCGEILTNARQYDAVKRSLSAISSAIYAFEAGITPDAILIDTENSMSALGELSGKTIRDDIVARIFERFCVGK